MATEMDVYINVYMDTGNQWDGWWRGDTTDVSWEKAGDIAILYYANI